jgi:hypothetical protein
MPPPAALSRLATMLVFLALLACASGRPEQRSDAVSPAPSSAQLDPADLHTRLILIGDAGDPRLVGGEPGIVVNEPVLALAQHWAARAPERTLVVFLGDNIYNDGMPEAGLRADSARARLGAQVEVVTSSGARGLFVPGNHDWGFGEEGILRQQAFVVERLGPRSFLPSDAMGGPAVVALDGVELVVLDTHWWVMRNRRRRCDAPTEELVLAMDSLRWLFSDSRVSYRVLIAHHPLDTYGGHRGMGVLRRMGSRLIGATQDLGTPAYLCMRRQLDELLAGPNRPLAAAAGHEHSLQVLDGGAVAEYILVSGAGSFNRVKGVGRGSTTRYAEGRAGFMILDFFGDRSVVLQAIVLDADPGGRIAYRQQLREGDLSPPTPSSRR